MKIILFLSLVGMHCISFGQTKDPYEHFTASPQLLMLRYDEVGPQVLANELIGFQWWQWEAHGDSNPETTYDIRVIVYKDILLKAVQQQYPVNPEFTIDFRYVSYSKIINYLDHIMKTYPKEVDIEKYAAVKEKIITHFKQ